MRYASLKQLDQSAVCAKLALSQWPRRNSRLTNKLAYTPLPSSHFLVGIDAYGGDKCWSGFVDLNEWLENVAPTLSSFASLDTALRFKELQELFNCSSRDLI